MAGGRPDKYESHVKPKLNIIAAWARNGLTDKQIADNLKVGYSNFMKYKKEYQELRESLNEGKDEADHAIENALYKKALEGDNTAMIFWLKNRRPDVWRDRKEVAGSLTLVENMLEAISDE